MSQSAITARPIVDQKLAKDLTLKLYGLQVIKISELNGYDDKNYHILVDSSKNNDNIGEICSSGYILKIVNSLDSKRVDFFEAQTSLLIYLGQNNVKCSKPVKTKDGEFFTVLELSSGRHIVRLLEFIDGRILHKVNCTKELFFEVGRSVAILDDVMKGFDHPAYHGQKAIWMLDSIPKLSEYIFAVKDESKRKIVEGVIEKFTNNVLPIVDNLEKGIIHGDYNEQNLIVQEKDGKWVLDAIIDFGDSHYSCYLFELAIAMTYMIIQGKNLDIGGYVLAGYKSVRNLPKIEFDLLKICIEARISQSVTLGAFAISEDPKNTYLLTTAEPGWKMLQELTNQPDEDLLKKWKEISDN